MKIDLKEDLLPDGGLTESDVRTDLAAGLYADHKVTLGRASKIAGCTQLEFQNLLCRLRIPLHYDIPDFEQDLALIRERS